ncbi:MAG: caspase domain-containing protein [Thiohalomonadales bacterium]
MDIKILKLIFVSVILLTNTIIVNAETRGITMESVTSKPKPKITNGTFRALIIGNNNYNDDQEKWPTLTTAIKDARAIEKILRMDYGFSDIKLLEDATRRDILIELDALSKRVASDDNVLIYYAGHGYIDASTKKGYWVPVDADGADKTTFLRNSTIQDEVAVLASRAKHTLLISDSCFSGTLLRRGIRDVRPNLNNDNYYKNVINKRSVQIISAGGVEYVDDNYNSSGHSPFSYFLLNELKNNNQPLLAVSELSSTVIRAVANNVDQVPESGILQGAGDELGEFIFIKVNLTVSGVAKDKIKVEVNVVSDEDKINYKNLPLPTL